MAHQDMDFYQTLRKKIKDWAQTDSGKSNKWVEIIVLAPDLFHLLCKLIIDPDVSVKAKVQLGLCIAYFVSPIDLVPEAIVGPIGYVDDIALAVYVLNYIINETEPEVIRRNWAGDGDIIKVVEDVLTVANDMVGKGLFTKLKKMVGK